MLSEVTAVQQWRESWLEKKARRKEFSAANTCPLEGGTPYPEPEAETETIMPPAGSFVYCLQDDPVC